MHLAKIGKFCNIFHTGHFRMNSTRMYRIMEMIHFFYMNKCLIYRRHPAEWRKKMRGLIAPSHDCRLVDIAKRYNKQPTFPRSSQGMTKLVQDAADD